MKRRNFIKSIMAVSAVTVTPMALMAKEEAVKAKKKGPNDLTYAAAVEAITGGKEVKDSQKVKLTVPEIAENGAVVPVKVEIDHPMDESNYVKAIHVLSTKNGNVRCVDVMLTPANGKGYFATRIKLSSTQEVVGLAELSDGTFIKAAKSVKVTIGGCG